MNSLRNRTSNGLKWEKNNKNNKEFKEGKRVRQDHIYQHNQRKFKGMAHERRLNNKFHSYPDNSILQRTKTKEK